MTSDDIKDMIAEAIDASLDVDWTPRDAARSVMERLRDEDVFFFFKPERLFIWEPET